MYTDTTRLTLSPIGNGTHVEITRHALPGDGLPPAMGAAPYTLAKPTRDGLTHAVMRGWQTGHVGAFVYTVLECPALARYLEETERCALAGEPRPMMSDVARAYLEALRAEYPNLDT